MPCRRRIGGLFEHVEWTPQQPVSEVCCLGLFAWPVLYLKIFVSLYIKKNNNTPFAGKHNGSASKLHVIKLIIQVGLVRSHFHHVSLWFRSLTSCHVGHRTAAPGRQRIESEACDSGLFLSCFTTLRIGAFLVRSQTLWQDKRSTCSQCSHQKGHRSSVQKTWSASCTRYWTQDLRWAHFGSLQRPHPWLQESSMSNVTRKVPRWQPNSMPSPTTINESLNHLDIPT